MVDTKVIVAVDGSLQAEEACEFYLQTLYRHTHTVILTHCLEIPYQPIPLREDMAEDLIRKCRDEAKIIDDKFCQKLDDKQVNYQLVTDFGQPGEFITKLSKQEHVALVVMGTRGLGKFRRTVLGSVSDYVLHHAHCSVVIYKHPRHDKS